MMTTLPASSPKWRHAVKSLVALRPVVALFWTVLGSTLMALTGRVLLVSQLKAQATATVQVESASLARDSVLTMAVDSLRANGRITTRAICFDHTQAQQAIIEVDCPRHLYRGAK